MSIMSASPIWLSHFVARGSLLIMFQRQVLDSWRLGSILYQRLQGCLDLSVSAKRHAAEPGVPYIGSHSTAYKNREVIVILSRGYRVPFDQSFRTCQNFRSSQKRPIRHPSGHPCVIFADTIVYACVLFAADAKQPWIVSTKST